MVGKTALVDELAPRSWVVDAISLNVEPGWTKYEYNNSVYNLIVRNNAISYN